MAFFLLFQLSIFCAQDRSPAHTVETPAGRVRTDNPIRNGDMNERQLQKFDIATAVTDSLIELFDSMLSMELELSDESAMEGLDGARIAGSVRLAGKVMGCINIHVTEAFSYQMTAAMLGIDIDEIEDEADVKDVISEVCNIVGGNLKSKFCDSGFTCQLSPPTFTRGNDFKIEALNTARHERYVFSQAGSPIIVDVGVRINEEDEAAIDNAMAAPRQLTSVDKKAFFDFDVRKPITGSLIEMFDMMLSMDLKTYDDGTELVLDDDKIVGSVSYVGQLMGTLNIYISDAFARTISAAMIGVEVGEIEGYGDIKDVVSEICNIVGGNLKSKLDDAGFASNLSTPSMTIGSDFSIESQNMMKYEKLAFHHENEVVYVEIGIKVSEEISSGGTDQESLRAALDQSANILDPQQAIDQIIKTKDQAPPRAATPPAGPDAADLEVPSDADGVSGENTGLEQNLEFLMDIPVCVTVELGRTRKKIKDVLDITGGSVVELTKLANEPVDLRVNDTLIAKGEIVVDNDKYGVRILETISRLQRIRIL